MTRGARSSVAQHGLSLPTTTTTTITTTTTTTTLLFLLLLLISSINISTVNAFYLPGVAPTDYALGDPVPLLVNALTSIDSKSLLAYDYYLPRFHFCIPKEGLEQQLESLGAILYGDRLYNSPFEVEFLSLPFND